MFGEWVKSLIFTVTRLPGWVGRWKRFLLIVTSLLRPGALTGERSMLLSLTSAAICLWSLFPPRVSTGS